MRTCRPTIVGAIALTLCAAASAMTVPAAATAAAAARRATQRVSTLLGGVNVVGVNGHTPLQDADSAIAAARALGAKVIRSEVPWSAFEPLGPGQIDPATQAFADRLVSDAASAQIKVIMTVDSAPCWASSAPAALLAGCSPSQPNGASSWPPREPADYAAFVSYLATRYGTRLAGIEVWNEPDQANEAYFAGPDKPERYAAVLRAAYPAIKAANPNVLVLAGSLVGPNGGFLRELYAAGIRGFYDGLAVHYYTLTLAAVRSIHEVQLANGDHTPLWLDEFGWSSCWPRPIEQEQGCVTAQTQAANITNTLRSLARAPYVAAAVAYKLSDSPSEEFGLLSASGARKPSFAGFAAAIATPFGAISRTTLSLARKAGHVVAAGSGAVGDYMRMEVFRGSVLRYHAFFTLDRFNRYSITLPSVLGTRGLQVRVYQYWAGPASAARKSI